MAEQFFYDAVLKTSVDTKDNEAATNMGLMKTFSQFNHWTLVDESDVEEMESKAEEEIPVTEKVNETYVGIENKLENTLVDTLMDEEASNASNVASDEEYESEELVSRETLLRLSEQAELRSSYL